MIEAKLISDVPQNRHTMYGDEIRIAHVQTRHGITAVRSVIPPNATQELVVAGGLLSGANYERVVNRAAERGFVVRTVRHGSNSIYGAIDADADEFAASIECLAQYPVHVLAHSKGARVAVKAGARLDSSVDLKTVLFANPAFERSQLPSPATVFGTAWEQIACMGKLGNAAKGVFHEVTRRGLGVIGETWELFRSDESLSEDLGTVHDKGVRLGLFSGSFDHIVPAAHIGRGPNAHFDDIGTMNGAVDGSHFGILASDRAVDFVLAHAS